MICCGKDLGKGEPFAMTRYWCETCKTEHLVDARELSEYLAKLHAERDAGDEKLPNIL